MLLSIPRLFDAIGLFCEELVETCVRSVFCQRARLLSWRWHKEELPWHCPHGRRGSGQSTGRSGKRRAKWRTDTRKGTKRGTEREQTLNQPVTMDDHEYGVMRTNTFLSQCGATHHSVCALCSRKMTCEVFLCTRQWRPSSSPLALILPIMLSPSCSCILFAIVSVQLAKLKFWAQQRELKWLMLNKQKRWFHSSRVKLINSLLSICQQVGSCVNVPES